MKRLFKFASLPPTERIFLIKSMLLIMAIRLGLRLLPFQTCMRVLTWLFSKKKALNGMR